MTPKLEAVFKSSSALPPEIQDLLAEQWLAELEDEQRWDEIFANSQDLLKSLAENARCQHQQGKTIAKGWDEL